MDGCRLVLLLVLGGTSGGLELMIYGDRQELLFSVLLGGEEQLFR